jgi:hypothetical protein
MKTRTEILKLLNIAADLQHRTLPLEEEKEENDKEQDADEKKKLQNLYVCTAFAWIKTGPNGCLFKSRSLLCT